MKRIELGDRVKDRISGLGGIAIGLTDWLYGCRRIVVQPEQAKDGKPAEQFCVDEQQLELVKAGVVVPVPVSAAAPPPVAPVAPPPPRTGGNRQDAERRPDTAAGADGSMRGLRGTRNEQR